MDVSGKELYKPLEKWVIRHLMLVKVESTGDIPVIWVGQETLCTFCKRKDSCKQKRGHAWGRIIECGEVIIDQDKVMFGWR